MIAVFVIAGLAIGVTLTFTAALCRTAGRDWPDIPDTYDAAMDETIGQALRAEAERIVP